MNTIARTSLWLSLAALIAGAPAAQAGGSQRASRTSGSATSGSATSGSATSGNGGGLGSRARGSRAGSRTVGQRAGVGSQAQGSNALGSVAASRVSGSQTAGSKPAGSAALGSVARGSRVAGSKPSGSRRAGSAALGSAAHGSRVAGSRTGGSGVTLGSQANGSRVGSVARGSRVGSVARGSRVGSRAIVPEISGTIPKMSSKDPGLLVVLADLSGSMAGGFAGSQDISKADALADVLNGVVNDFVDRNNVGGTIRPRLDVVLEGYNGAGSNPLFEGALRGQEIVSIADLADNPSGEIDVDDGEGNMIPRDVFVNPTATGGTPMKAAFGKVQATVSKWGRRPAGRHIVLGVHVSDGESTDGSPEQELADLAADVQAKGGELLMTNIHLSSSGGPSSGVVFPDDADAASFDDHGKLLFKMSSPVPAALAEKLGTKPGARMMAYNATLEQFAKVFEAGSSVAAQ